MDDHELLRDETFLNYCFQRNAEHVAYWENYLKENPHAAPRLLKLKRQLVATAHLAMDQQVDNGYAKLQQKIASKQMASGKQRSSFPVWFRYAAMLCLVAMAGIYLFNHQQNSTELTSAQLPAEILPANNKAFLTLADGTVTLLSDTVRTITETSGITATQQHGQLVYGQPNQIAISGKQPEHTVTTPRSGQYQVVLPDGTKAWLNAASSLTYPVVFSAASRQVSVTGEVYFEVTKDKHRPFQVTTEQSTIEVLGTHFNVNAYNDNAQTRITLVEGSVRVNSNQQTALLIPGQQAVAGKSLLQVVQADIERDLSWKNGDFIFRNEKLTTILTTISRWYDVDIIYEHPNDELVFEGMVARTRNLDAVLNMIESTGKVRFEVEGRRVTVRQ